MKTKNLTVDRLLLLKVLAVKQVEHSGGGWTVSQCVARWRSRLSVVMQRAISVTVAEAFARTSQARGRPPPDVGAFARRRLLLRPAAVT
jgi:hypothetical protein